MHVYDDQLIQYIFISGICKRTDINEVELYARVSLLVSFCSLLVTRYFLPVFRYFLLVTRKEILKELCFE